jgi:hypothetical protein
MSRRGTLDVTTLLLGYLSARFQQDIASNEVGRLIQGAIPAECKQYSNMKMTAF